MDDRESLRALLLERSVRLGDFTLSSGAKSLYYVAARRTPMTAEGQRLTGKIGYDLIEEAGWDVTHVGGLTLGAAPVTYAIAHHSTARRTPPSAARSSTVRVSSPAPDARARPTAAATSAPETGPKSGAKIFV